MHYFYIGLAIAGALLATIITIAIICQIIYIICTSYDIGKRRRKIIDQLYSITSRVDFTTQLVLVDKDLLELLQERKRKKRDSE